MRLSVLCFTVSLVAGCRGSAVTFSPASTDAAATPGGPAPDLAAGSDAGSHLGSDAGLRDLGLADLATEAALDLTIGVDLSTEDLSTVATDLTPPSDLLAPPADLRGDGGPGGDDSPLAHAPPSALPGAATLLSGQDVLDVSTDQGGGVWAVTAAKVYYFAPGSSTPYRYDQSNGLARGWTTWNDTWFGFGSTAAVTFASVAGATSGQAVVGTIGAIADRIQVDPASGAITRLDNMTVDTSSGNPERLEQARRVVTVKRAIADLNGTFQGTAYLGGFHGFYAFHGLNSDCGCMAFQQHQHAFADFAMGGIAGSDPWGLALSLDGDVWQGDRDVVALWPQRSLGASTDFFQAPMVVLDVFPGVRDEVWGLGVDAGGGVYVASFGNGLAYLAPATYTPSYWSRDGALPQNRLTDVTVDTAGEVWVATQKGGAARFNPTTNTWTYYTWQSGLASNHVRRLYVDKYSAARVIYFATGNGVTVVHP